MQRETPFLLAFSCSSLAEFPQGHESAPDKCHMLLGTLLFIPVTGTTFRGTGTKQTSYTLPQLPLPPAQPSKALGPSPSRLPWPASMAHPLLCVLSSPFSPGSFHQHLNLHQLPVPGKERPPSLPSPCYPRPVSFLPLPPSFLHDSSPPAASHSHLPLSGVIAKLRRTVLEPLLSWSSCICWLYKFSSTAPLGQAFF